MKDLLLEWAFASENTLPQPVRADHFDQSPVDYQMVEGRTQRSDLQHWYLPGFEELYHSWEFTTDGRTRE